MEFLTLFVSSQLKIRNWSERELARASGLTPAAINGALKCVKDVRLSTIVSIAKALGVSPSYLIASPQERAIWDSKQAHAIAPPPAKVWDAIYKLQQEMAELKNPATVLESALPRKPSGHLLPELENLANEFEREINAHPSKKNVRKTGSE